MTSSSRVPRLLALSTLLSAGIAAACVQAPVRAPMLNRTAKPVQYSTYFIVNDRDADGAPIDTQIRAALEAAFADKAWVEVAPEYAETAVVIHRATTGKQSLDAFYDGWGDWEWRQTASGSTAAGAYAPGTVLVDLFDAETKHLVWRAVAPRLVDERSPRGPRLERSALARVTAALPVSGFAGPASSSAIASTQAPGTPNIVFAHAPAVLVRIDGEALYAPAPGTDLQRVTNTRAFVVRDPAGTYYTKVAGYWMQSYDLLGPWAPTGVVPYGADAALQRAVAAHEVSLASGGPRTTEGSADRGAPDNPPTVIVGTSPTALVVTDGDPRFERVGGTALLRMVNATVPVFREPTDDELYVRLLGRWFRAWTIQGPWEAVPDDKLPADLARVL